MSNDKPLVSFDYAIKYLLKDKGDFGIVEGFISALLKTRGYKEIKIISLLESESNKEDSKSKRSLADLIVEDEDHNKYIVEIERNIKDSFIHKSLFNTSRLIVDNLAQREDYTQIIKIFHISLLYFPIGNGSGSIYHGQTIIHEIETNDRLSVHIKNQQTQEEFDATNILPEYFYISVPLFNDRLEKEMDDWLHVMKYDEVPQNYHSPYMSQVAEKLNILKMTPKERANYSYYQKKLHDDRDELKAAEARGREEGEARGEARGEEKKAILIAKNLLKAGLAIDVIADSTGLTIEQIEALK
jgi:predicted transposase/invertase (TIGR01784 family)